MKITISQMKQAIADQAKNEYQHIINQFCEDGETPEEDLKDCVKNKATDPKQWECKDKKDKGNDCKLVEDFMSEFFSGYLNLPKGVIRHSFDCTPFDDQLRAYVYTDSQQSQVLRIDINGE